MVEIEKNIDKLVAQIRSGKAGRDKVISELYFNDRLKSKVKSIVVKYGGRPDDFDSVFNTTLMQFVKSVLNKEDFRLEVNLEAYLVGIARYVWLAEVKKNNKNRYEDMDDQYDLGSSYTPETMLIDQGRKELLHDLLGKLGGNCREVLMHWANGFKMTEIAEMMNYKSDSMARTKKYKCFKELLNYLEVHPEVKNVLRS